MSLRDAAKGKPCMYRIPGVCNNDWETTVLSHLRDAHVAGIAQKPNDLIAALGCSACHDAVDDRRYHVKSYQFDGETFDHSPIGAIVDIKYEGLVRTLDYWHDNGRISYTEFGEIRWEAI